MILNPCQATVKLASFIHVLPFSLQELAEQMLEMTDSIDQDKMPNLIEFSGQQRLIVLN